MVEIFVHSQVGVDTTTLASKTAQLVDTLMSDADANFMFKNIRTEFIINTGDLGDQLLLVLAPSDATTTQIAAALVNTSTSRDDAVNYPRGQNDVRQTWDFFVSPLKPGEAVGHLEAFTHQWKLPPKGVPVLKGGGLSIFAYNMSSFAFVDGPIVSVISKSMGGWF